MPQMTINEIFLDDGGLFAGPQTDDFTKYDDDLLAACVVN